MHKKVGLYKFIFVHWMDSCIVGHSERLKSLQSAVRQNIASLHLLERNQLYERLVIKDNILSLLHNIETISFALEWSLDHPYEAKDFLDGDG